MSLANLHLCLIYFSEGDNSYFFHHFIVIKIFLVDVLQGVTRVEKIVQQLIDSQNGAIEWLVFHGRKNR